MKLHGKTIAFALIWLIGAVIAVFFASVHLESAFVDGEFIPRTNDSFYHARRILDAAIGSGFYEFDPRMHVPDGSWISWPWGYDYLAAQALRIALWLNPALDPMAFLSYVPVAFVAINCALFVAALAQSGLRVSLAVPAVLGFAMLPVSQIMHSVGMIDHHFLEFSFVLLANWLGLRWFSDTANQRHAIALGIALGAAVAFHNGLFALQIPLLTCTFLLWLRHETPDRRAIIRLAGSLLVTTFLVVLASQPFRELMFEFALLSWFHLYIALCTSVVLIVMAYTQRSAKTFAVLAGVSLLLAVPILLQALRGASFVSGDMTHLDTIAEVRSPFEMFTNTWGPYGTASFYSWMIVTTPALLGLFAWRCLRETRPKALYFAVWGTFGLSLLLMQYRLHYFGIFALIAGCCLALQELADRYKWKQGIAAVVALGAIMLAWQPALRDRLFMIYAPASDDDYAYARDIFKELEPLCENDPGLVLASNDDGSPILFHTQCSVISNNFIMRPEDEAALSQITGLMTSTPEAILTHEPAIKYVFLRTLDFAQPGQPDDAISIDLRSAVASQLLTDQPPPPGFQSVHSVYRANEPGDPVYLYARLLKVDRSAIAAQASR